MSPSIPVIALLECLSLAGTDPLPTCARPSVEAFEQERYAAAAQLAQQCWELSQHARTLYYLGQSFERANLETHAMQAYAAYVALDDDEPEFLADARQALADLRSKATPISLTLSPSYEDADEEGSVVATLKGSDAAPIEFSLASSDGTRGFRVLPLSAGRWKLRVSRVGHRPVERDIRIESGGVPITLVLELEPEQPPPPPPAPQRIRFTLNRAPPSGRPVRLRIEDLRGEGVDLVAAARSASAMLLPRRWSVSATHEDYRTTSSEFSVVKGGQSDVQLRLRPTPRTAVRNGFGLGYAALGGALTLAGIATIIAAEFARGPDDKREPIIVPQTMTRITGLGLVGAGVGLGKRRETSCSA